MAENKDDLSVSIESSKQVVSSSIWMKLPNFFAMSEYDAESEIDSPTFEFANATWRFQFWLSKDSENEKTQYLSVCMKRVYYEIPQQRIICTNTLSSNSYDYSSINDEYLFKKDESVSMGYFECHDTCDDKSSTLTLLIQLIWIIDHPTQANDHQIPATSVKGLTSLSQDLKDVLLHGQGKDLTFKVGETEFRAHQDILRARSEVFRSMLSHDMREKHSGVIDVPDCEPRAFEQLLLYVYTGKVDALDENNMFGLYYAADKYNMQHLKEECCEVIKKSLAVTNICQAIDLALKHSDAALLDYATQYFHNNIEDVLATVEWQIFLKENSVAANELIIKSVKRLKISDT